MGFSISYDIGALGYLVVALMAGAGLILLVWLLQAARDARRQVKDHEQAIKEGPGVGDDD